MVLPSSIQETGKDQSRSIKKVFLQFCISASLVWLFSCNSNLEEKRTIKNTSIEQLETDSTKLASIQKAWLESKQVAQEEIEKYGIPSFQKIWYVEWKSERAFHNITPFWYGDLLLNLDRKRRYENNLGRDSTELIWIYKWESLRDWKIAEKDVYYKVPKRDDAFLLYLWMPQKNNSFGISDYQPSHSQDTMKIYFKPNYWTSDMRQSALDDYFESKKYANDTWINKIICNERTWVFRSKQKPDNDGISDAKWVTDNPLWDFMMWEWRDEKWHYIFLYDIRDLNPFWKGKWASSNKENSEDLLQKILALWHDVDENTEVSSLFWAGHPFEIYDRIYYNPDNKKIVDLE